MRTSCLINNFNYEDYIIDAVNSALNQTVPFDEIIVVDDGSSDGSLARLQQNFDGHERVKIIAKDNQGQLSSFNEGFQASSGDIVFFLDADDLYEPRYLEEAMAFYKNNPHCDFLFFALATFGTNNRQMRAHTSDKHLGFSILATLYQKKWIGSPTSAVSMRRNILGKILPMPPEYLKDWHTRADDCLVWGASLAGAYKCYCDRPLVRYRIHGSNNFSGNKFDYKYRLNRVIAVNKLFNHFQEIFAYKDDHDFYKLLKPEFRTIKKPSSKDTYYYIQMICMLDIPLTKRVEAISSIIGSYIASKMSI